MTRATLRRAAEVLENTQEFLTVQAICDILNSYEDRIPYEPEKPPDAL